MEQLFLSRQPVFGRDGMVWGYEILSRTSVSAECTVADVHENPPRDGVSNLFKSPETGSSAAQCIMHLDEASLYEMPASAMDSDRLILGISSSMLAAGNFSEKLDDLRGNGTRLSLTIDEQQGPGNQDISGYQLVAFPFDLLGASMRWDWLEKRDAERTKLLINKIETHAELEFAKAAGADLFQGNFFKRPRTMLLERLPSVMVNRFKLLELLEAPSDRSQELIRVIEADVSITLRLFRFINSPHFGLTRKIESIRQCVQLLGWAQLKTWIRMLVVMEMCPADKTKELAYSSALRGRFLELLALYSNRLDLADNLFLLGLFSLLEPILERTYPQILKDFSLPRDVESALLGQGGSLLPWLEFINILDDGNWLRVDVAAMHLNLDLRCVSRAKLDALAWTNQFWNMSK